MEAQTRLAEVILLENDDERQSTLGVVGDLYVKLPQSPDDHAAFEADIEKCRGGLAAMPIT